MCTIREAIPEQDFPAIAELLNLVNVNPVPTTAEGLQRAHQRTAPGQLVQRLVAEDKGELIGYTSIRHDPWMPPDQFFVYVLTPPDHRQRGIGTALYTAALEFVRSQGGKRVTAEVPDHEQVGLAFAQKRGFSIDRHQFNSKLEITAFDETPYTGIVEGLEAQGIRFFTMADVPDTEEMQRKLYDLYRAVTVDIPGMTGQRPFEDFQSNILHSDWYRRDAQLLAADGEVWVGLGTLRYTPTTGSVYLQMTGVDRPYRGRKIATALKLWGIRWARAVGTKGITTSNDSRNAPILAINQKMGFVPEQGRYQLVATVDLETAGHKA